MALAGRRAPGIGQRSSCRTSAKVPRSKLVANFRTPRFDVVKAVATHLGTLLLGSPQQTQVYPSLCLALPPRLVFRRSAYRGGDACINRKCGAKPAEECDSIWLLAW